MRFQLSIPSANIPRTLSNPPSSNNTLTREINIANRRRGKRILQRPNRGNKIMRPRSTYRRTMMNIRNRNRRTTLINTMLIRFNLIAIRPILEHTTLRTPIMTRRKRIHRRLTTILPTRGSNRRPTRHPNYNSRHFKLRTNARSSDSIGLATPLTGMLPNMRQTRTITRRGVKSTKVRLLHRHDSDIRIIRSNTITIKLNRVTMVHPNTSKTTITRVIITNSRSTPNNRVLNRELMPISRLRRTIKRLRSNPRLALQRATRYVRHPTQCTKKRNRISRLARIVLLFHLRHDSLNSTNKTSTMALVLNRINHRLATRVTTTNKAILFRSSLVTLRRSLRLQILISIRVNTRLLKRSSTTREVSTPGSTDYFRVRFSLSIYPRE